MSFWWYDVGPSGVALAVPTVGRYYSRSSSNDLPTRPPVAPLMALDVMRGARVGAIANAQDKCPGTSRRHLGGIGLLGQYDTTSGFSIPLTNPDSGSNTYPSPTTVRPIGAVRADLTPGSFPKLDMVYLPSGQTQVSDGAGGYDAGGAGATIRCAVKWIDAAGTELDETYDLPLAPSARQYAGLDVAAGKSWDHARVVSSGIMVPAGIYTSVVTLRQWTRPPVAVEIVVSVIGGARVVDCSVSEVPVAYALEADDDPSTEWVGHVYSDGSPPALAYPYQRRSETSPDGDPRLGTWHLMDVHRAQVGRLGPVLFSWQAYQENVINPTTAVHPAWTTASTTNVGIPDITRTSWLASSFGWSLSCGGYARGWDSDSPLVLDDIEAALPMLVAVLADTTGTGSVVRVQSSVSSYVELPIVNNGALTWHFARWHSGCQINPERHSVAQAFGRTATGTLSVAAIACYYLRLDTVYTTTA